MAGLRHRINPRYRELATWLWLAKFMGLLLFVALLFLLAQSMVQHHFFTGGA
jgi:hypothetical protein